jgi:hypothetical protein
VPHVVPPPELQRAEAHCEEKAQLAPASRVPAVAHAGLSWRRNASHGKAAHSAVHANVFSSVRDEPSAKKISGQSRALISKQAWLASGSTVPE